MFRLYVNFRQKYARHHNMHIDNRHRRIIANYAEMVQYFAQPYFAVGCHMKYKEQKFIKNTKSCLHTKNISRKNLNFLRLS